MAIGNNFIGRVFRQVLLLFFLSTLSIYSVDKHIAVLPSLLDNAYGKNAALARDFQHALQYHLQTRYSAKIVSRAQLSVIAFENKAHILKNPKLKKYTIQPCDCVLFSIYDGPKKTMRIYPIVNLEGAAPKSHISVSLKNRDNLDESALKAAQDIAKALKLEALQSPKAKMKDPAVKKSKSKKTSVIVSTSGFSKLTSAHAEKASYLGEVVASKLQECVDQGGGFTLLDRRHLSQIVKELELKGVSYDSDVSPASIQTADIMIQPYVYASGKHLYYLIYAIDPQSSVILDALRILPKEIDSKTISEFVERAMVSRDASRKIPENAEQLRRSESELYQRQFNKYLGMRMEQASCYKMDLMILQAALGLTADDPERTLELLFSCISKVSGAYALSKELKEEYVKTFQLPVSELSGTFNYNSLFIQTKYHLVLQNAQKVIDILQQNDARPYRPKLHSMEASAYYKLKRYRECHETILKNRRFDSYSMILASKALIQDGHPERAQNLLYKNRRFIGKNYSLIIELIRLTRKSGNPAASVEFWKTTCNSWYRIQPIILCEIAPCFLDLKDEESATAIYQSIILNPYSKNTKYAKTARLELEKMGAKFKNLTTITGVSALRIDDSCFVELISDDTISLDELKAAAQVYSDFWGLKVNIYHNALNFKDTSYYDPARKTLECNPIHNILFRHAWPQSDRCIYRYYLSKIRFISKRENYVGDVFSSFSATTMIGSTHYIHKLKAMEKRSIAEVTAIMMSGLKILDRTVNDQGLPRLLRIQPYCMSNNINLTFGGHILSLSEREASILARLKTQHIIESVAKANTQIQEHTNMLDVSEKDLSFIQQASATYKKQQPIIIQPRK